MRIAAVAALASWVGLAVPASADDVSVRAEVDARRIGAQDHLQLTVTVEGRQPDLEGEVTPPPLENLRVVGGPSVQQQYSFVNGTVSQSRSYVWVLAPRGAGPAQIGAARVKLAGGERSTEPIAIEVVPGSARPRATPRTWDPFGDEDPFGSFFGRRQAREEPKLSVTAEASRKRLHVGEPLLLTYSVDTQTSISDVGLSEAPQYPGFWAEDLEASEGPSRGERVTRKGEAYVRYPILRKVLFPTRSGSLVIPPATFRLRLARGSFFGSDFESVTRSTSPVTVTVDPIPSGPRFSGAVGRFKATARLDRNEVALGEAATVRFTVEGKGNLKWVESTPDLEVPGAKVYPPQTKTDVRVGREGMRGSRTWEFVVVPETGGALTVPSLRFSYFDPSAGSIREVETAPLSLIVKGALGSGAAGAAPSTAAQRRGGGLALRSDLEWPRRSALGARHVAWGLAMVGAFHGLLWGGAALSGFRLRGGRGAPRRRVRRVLAELDKAGRGDLPKEAAALAIERALHEAFGPSDGDPRSEGAHAAREVLQEVQAIRYAPQLGDYSEALRNVAGRAAEVVRRWA